MIPGPNLHARLAKVNEAFRETVDAVRRAARDLRSPAAVLGREDEEWTALAEQAVADADRLAKTPPARTIEGARRVLAAMQRYADAHRAVSARLDALIEADMGAREGARDAARLFAAALAPRSGTARRHGP